mmetsp:Transcript_59508/g.166196  ORF Transcript_59508/g.166196 Transcript_59508/m.166196 type:complete len:295 (-) Transcript_59508:37-921(-)
MESAMMSAALNICDRWPLLAAASEHRRLANPGLRMGCNAPAGRMHGAVPMRCSSVFSEAPSVRVSGRNDPASTPPRPDPIELPFVVATTSIPSSSGSSAHTEAVSSPPAPAASGSPRCSWVAFSTPASPAGWATVTAVLLSRQTRRKPERSSPSTSNRAPPSGPPGPMPQASPSEALRPPSKESVWASSTSTEAWSSSSKGMSDSVDVSLGWGMCTRTFTPASSKHAFFCEGDLSRALTIASPRTSGISPKLVLDSSKVVPKLGEVTTGQVSMAADTISSGPMVLYGCPGLKDL